MPLFTPQTARENAAKAHEARRENRERRRQEAEEAAQAQTVAPHEDDYVAKRIASARAQIERLEALALTLSDALDIERTARAVASWSEIERVLSGRPLPGSRRPGKERPISEAEIKPL